eukprot:GHVQ01018800.1.p1 GENE.GHVQ01018800.1~~GHVQ01018800.1.p1  ORF type:complete len:231 (-),score=29.50 GHVQ01018800.1:60-752(-)
MYPRTLLVLFTVTVYKMYCGSYKFSNLLGGVYSGGALQLSGNGLLSAVGNRLNYCDLTNSNSICLPCESRRNLQHVLTHPTHNVLALLIDEAGHCSVVNLRTGLVLEQIQFKAYSTVPTYNNKRGNKTLRKDTVNAVSCAVYSPDGKYFAVAIARKVQIWTSPSLDGSWNLSVHRELSGHLEAVSSIDWSTDGCHIITCSSDTTARLYHTTERDVPPIVFVDHRYVSAIN